VGSIGVNKPLRDLLSDLRKPFGHRTMVDGFPAKAMLYTQYSCFRGNVKREGIFWVVRRSCVCPASEPVIPVGHLGVFIECIKLTNYRSGPHGESEWVYKRMDESMHPFYYNCPLKYLEATVNGSETNHTWRDLVLAYHEQKGRKLKSREKYLKQGS
jgi:hypothetical protein